MSDDDETPRWREDFPIQWESDSYVTRRELAKFLTLGSAFLVGASTTIAVAGRLRTTKETKPMLIAGASELAAGHALLFRYPTEEDRCILLRTHAGQLVAFSQICTHLSCAVVYQEVPERLFCPCHNGAFSCTEGLPIAGPPTRRLPRIVLEERAGDIFAVGVEV